MSKESEPAIAGKNRERERDPDAGTTKAICDSVRDSGCSLPVHDVQPRQSIKARFAPPNDGDYRSAQKEVAIGGGSFHRKVKIFLVRAQIGPIWL
jgi:hypothetical protein